MHINVIQYAIFHLFTLHVYNRVQIFKKFWMFSSREVGLPICKIIILPTELCSSTKLFNFNAAFSTEEIFEFCADKLTKRQAKRWLNIASGSKFKINCKFFIGQTRRRTNVNVVRINNHHRLCYIKSYYIRILTLLTVLII